MTTVNTDTKGFDSSINGGKHISAMDERREIRAILGKAAKLFLLVLTSCIMI